MAESDSSVIKDMIREHVRQQGDMYKEALAGLTDDERAYFNAGNMIVTKRITELMGQKRLSDTQLLAAEARIRKEVGQTLEGFTEADIKFGTLYENLRQAGKKQNPRFSDFVSGVAKKQTLSPKK